MVFISSDQWGFCVICGENRDLRFGYCFDCADEAKSEEDLCYRGGLGNYDPQKEQCSIKCKFSVKCRRKKDAISS